MKTVLLAVVAASVMAAAVAAHQVTYKGTVLAVEKATVRVNAIDEKTKKASTMTFQTNKNTKVLRGDALVTLDAARIEKGEKIAVTVDHDLDETMAIVIRLDPKK